MFNLKKNITILFILIIDLKNGKKDTKEDLIKIC